MSNVPREEKPAFFVNPDVVVNMNAPCAEMLVKVLNAAAANREIEFPSPVFAFLRTLESELKFLQEVDY